MSLLKIYLSGQWRDNSSPCAWALCDEKNMLLQTGTTPLANMPKGHECVAIVAADKVLNIVAKLPGGSARKLQAMLPFVAEEFTLADPEENHVVPSEVLADGRRMLVVMDRHWLKGFLHAVQQAGLSLRRMVAETLLPAATADSWTLVWDGRSGFAKTGVASGIVLDIGDENCSPLALRLSLENAPQIPKNIELRYPYDVAGEQRTLPQWGDVQSSLVAGVDWDWRRAVIGEDALNLLWGEFRPRAKIQEWWPKLRPAVYLLLAVLIVETVGSNIEWAMLASDKSRASKEMEKTFRATFGDTVTLVNAPLQMQRNLAELKHLAGVPAAGDFLSLLNLASATLAALPAGSMTGLHFEAGRLDIDFKLSRRADFNELYQNLLGSGLGVRMGEVRDTGNGAEARLTLIPEGMR